MLIMIIFICLSLLIALFTAVYLNSKKKKMINDIKVDNTEKKSNSKKELKDILKIKIKDSIIQNGTRYSSILKLGNIDYNMLSDSEQESVESVLIQTALGIDYPIQFFSTTEYIDTTKVVKTIRNNKTTNQKVEEYKENLIFYLENLMENKSISVVKNYAIISYDGYYENALDELNRRVANFKGSLLRAKIQCELLEENEIYNLIYRELNKNSNVKIDSLLKGSEKLYVGKKQKIKK
ncbi:MAG: hypothetical protein IJW20_07175 [Clostridia bacterium]|nr:hypothetical protein [Clostridia bacterium]